MQSDVSGELTGLLAALVGFGVLILMLAANWKIFTKAGQPGWACLVPIYNVVVLLKIIQRPMWWVVLMLVPLVSIVVAIITLFDLAKVFGKGAGFGVGLLFLPFIFYPILGFDESEYQGQC
jgi:hypothetical protein